jgi:hypothetical protein
VAWACLARVKTVRSIDSWSEVGAVLNMVSVSPRSYRQAKHPSKIRALRAINDPKCVYFREGRPQLSACWMEKRS